METLFQKSDQWLASSGQMALVLTSSHVKKAIRMAQSQALYLTRTVSLIPFPGRPEKRQVLEFSRCKSPLKRETLVIEQSRHRYTDAFKELTAPYYLPRTFQING